MEMKPPEPQDAFQGYMIAMVQTMYDGIKDNTARVRKLEGQAHRLIGTATALGAIGGFVAMIISKLTWWKS